MTDPEMLSWLRAAITERLELARKATRDPWEPEGDDPLDDEIYAGGDDDERFGWRLVICRGPQSHENMLHIAANDPQDTIARCEAELAILDEHALMRDGDSDWCRVCDYDAGGSTVNHGVWRPCRTVRLLAAGYKHRPGWKAEWAP